MVIYSDGIRQVTFMTQKRVTKSPEKMKQRIAPQVWPAQPSCFKENPSLLQLQQIVGNGHLAQFHSSRGSTSHPSTRCPGDGSTPLPRVQRQPKQGSNAPKKADPGTFKPRKVTLEDVVKEMHGLGGPYADLKAWTDTFKAGKFLGHPIDAGPWSTKGVRPEFQALLDAAEPKINDEFKKSGNAIPTGYGIRSIGGFRSEINVHGAGVAIDIDGGDNPYIMHEGDVQGTETTLSTELRPVYHNIAEFMLNDPIDGEQSIIPKLIGSGDSLPKGGKPTRRERLGQYYDRLAKESDAASRKRRAGASSAPTAQPPIARQPATPTAGPGHRVGEAWDSGPITRRKWVTHNLVTFIGWVKNVERGYGPDKQMVLQRLRQALLQLV